VSLAGFRVVGFVGACGVVLSIKKQRFLLDHEFSKSPIYSDFTATARSISFTPSQVGDLWSLKPIKGSA
jgi:hypothetical protein